MRRTLSRWITRLFWRKAATKAAPAQTATGSAQNFSYTLVTRSGLHIKPSPAASGAEEANAGVRLNLSSEHGYSNYRIHGIEP